MTRAPGWDPVPADARVELERLGARWRTLPLPQALRHAPALRALAGEFAAECVPDATVAEPRGAAASGTPGAAPPRTAAAASIPDLGPAAAYDQLAALTFEVARRLEAADARESLAGLADRLARLRRSIT